MAAICSRILFFFKKWNMRESKNKIQMTPVDTITRKKSEKSTQLIELADTPGTMMRTIAADGVSVH